MPRKRGPSTIRRSAPGVMPEAVERVTYVAEPIRRKVYSVPEFALMLGVSDSHLYRQIEQFDSINGVPVIKVGRRYVIPAHLADRLIDGAA